MGILDAILDTIGDSVKKWAKKKGNPVGKTHYFWRDESGVAHEEQIGSAIILLMPGLICVLALLFGILDIKQFNRKKGKE